jgi:hypothetical protein
VLHAGRGEVICEITIGAGGAAGAQGIGIGKKSIGTEGDAGVCYLLTKISPLFGTDLHASLTPIICELTSRAVKHAEMGEIIGEEVGLGGAFGLAAVGGVVSE